MNNISAHRILVNVLAAASIFIYGTAVLCLHQDRSFPFYIEESGPFPAAISHRFFATPPGLVDRSLLSFANDTAGLSAAQAVDQVVDQIVQGKIPSARAASIIADGIGVGAVIVTGLSFGLFGPHAHSLVLLFIGFIGVSTTCFMLRYQDERLTAVPLVLLTLTLLLITPFTAPEQAAQAPVGGMRSYGLIGILPALHWFFEFTGGKASRPSAAFQAILLATQVAVLGLSMLVRGSTIFLLITIAAMALVVLYKEYRNKAERRRLLTLLLFPAALLVTLGGLTRLVFHEHAQEGRLKPVVWHRVFISLGAHPEWPFAGIRDKYSCPGIPEGILPTIVDRNGHCVWLTYAHAHGVPESTAPYKTYNGDYERVLRAAFFATLVSYPRQTIETFLYYKPKGVMHQIGFMFSPERFHSTRTIAALVTLQIMLVVAFIGAQLPRTPLSEAKRQASVLLFFLVPAFIPQFSAWTLPSTAIEFFACWYAGCVIIFWMIVAFAFRFITAKVLVRFH